MSDFAAATSRDYGKEAYPGGEVLAAVLVNRVTGQLGMIAQVRPSSGGFPYDIIVESSQITELTGGAGHDGRSQRSFFADGPLEETLADMRRQGFVPASRSDIPDSFIRHSVEVVSEELLKDDRWLFGQLGDAEDIMEAFGSALASTTEAARPNFSVIDPPVLMREWTNDGGAHKEVTAVTEFTAGEEEMTVVVARRFRDGILVDKKDIAGPKTEDFNAGTVEARFRSHGYITLTDAAESGKYIGEKADLGKIITERLRRSNDVREIGLRLGGELPVHDIILQMRTASSRHAHAL